MRRRLLLVLVVSVVAAVAGALLWLRPTPRFIQGQLAIGPGEALLLTRHNESRGSRAWIDRVDAGGALRWSAELTPLEVNEALGFTGLAANDELIVALARGPDGDVVVGLDLATGARRWQSTLPPVPRSDTPIGTSVLLDGPRAVLVRVVAADGTVGATLRLDAVALADGAHLWHHDPGDDGDVRRLAPDRLLVTPRDQSARVLDGATGLVVESPTISRVLCPLPNGVLAAAIGQMVVLPSTPASVLPVEAMLGPTEGPCGDRDGDLVVTLNRSDASGAAVVRRAADTGQPRWPAALSGRLFNPMVAIDGRLPRFLPLTMFGDDGNDALLREFAVLDLDTGDVVARGPLDETAAIVVSAHRGWLWLRFRGVLVGFDPTTGAYASATRVADTRPDDIRHEDVRFHGLWLHGEQTARPGALPWAHVDLATGFLTTHGSITTSDATAEFRAVFAR